MHQRFTGCDRNAQFLKHELDKTNISEPNDKRASCGKGESMSIRFHLFTLRMFVAAVSFGASSATPAPESCPVPTADKVTPEQRASYEESQSRSYRKAAVLVGVDTLGRVLVAIDHDHDGLADDCALFTDKVRLDGPWSVRLDEADVESRLGTLKIEAQDKSFALAVAVAGSELPRLTDHGRPFARLFAEEDGAELSRMLPGYGQYGNALANMSHTDITTWPKKFLVRPT